MIAQMGGLYHKYCSFNILRADTRTTCHPVRHQQGQHRPDHRTFGHLEHAPTIECAQQCRIQQPSAGKKTIEAT